MLRASKKRRICHDLYDSSDKWLAARDFPIDTVSQVAQFLRELYYFGLVKRRRVEKGRVYKIKDPSCTCSYIETLMGGF